jgi:O-antigen/teichoic acid export membrane protein
VSAVAAVPRNAGVLFVGRVAAQGLAVVMTVVLAARLGVTGLGEYALVSAVVFVANVATTFGTDMVLVREIAAGGRVARSVAALMVQLALSALAIVLISALAPVIPGQSGDVVAALRIYSLSLLPAAVYSVSTAVLRGVGMMGAYAGLGVVAVAIQLGFIALLVGAGSSVVRVAVVLLAAQAVIAVAAGAVCALRIGGLRPLPRTSRPAVAAMARESASVGVLGLLGVVYQRIGAIAVSVLVGPAATGWYAGASRITEASKTGHLALFGAVYPAMAQDQSGPRSEAGVTPALGWSWRVCVALGGVVTAGLLVLGPALVDWFYGPAFAPSKGGLAILALAVVPSTMATYQSLALLAAHREADTVRVLAICLGVLVVASSVLVPALGWQGACWAVVAADTTQAGLMIRARAGLGRSRASRPLAVASTGLGRSR